MPGDPFSGEGGWLAGPEGEGAPRPLPPGLRETVPDSVAPDDEQHRQAAEVEAAEAGVGRVDAPAEPEVQVHNVPAAGNTSAAPGNVLVELPVQVAKTCVLGLENQAKYEEELSTTIRPVKLGEVHKTRAKRLTEAAVQLRAVLLRDDLS